MGALEPLFLLAGALVGVPLLLHLVQRHEGHRLPFPALRYLQRTERDHARRIRSRQILLLLLRVAVVVGLVSAGARLFVRGRGSEHPPTALALVLDNSMSSGRIVGEHSVLDGLKSLALRSLNDATEADLIWVLRAGEPWAPLAPSSPEEARRLVQGTEPTDARGDLTAALARGAALVSASGLPAREIQLLSDLQANAFADTTAPAGAVPAVVWTGSAADVGGPSGGATAGNRSLVSLVLGGGLPPLVGERADVTVRLADASAGDTLPVAVRLVVDDQVRGAGTALPGAATSLALPAAPSGWVRGYADIDPDALRADDRRYFAFRGRPAPAVAVAGDPGVFVREAVAVLAGSGRVAPHPAGDADLLVSAAGEGLDGLPDGGAVLLVPPADGSVLPALDRRLQEAGIPWRLERSGAGGSGAPGGAVLSGESLPESLSGVRVHQWYSLVPTASPGATTGRTLARIGARPWAVEGTDARGRRYLLLASSLDAASSSLPVSPAMVRFVAWITGEWAAAGSGAEDHLAGVPLEAPPAATAVRLPSGERLPLDETRTVRATGQAGFYTFLAGDSVVAVEAVNPPPRESDLTPLPTRRLREAVGSGVVPVGRTSAWAREIFRRRRGRELWRGLLLGVLALLVLEGAVAAAGRSSQRSVFSAARAAGASEGTAGTGGGARGAV